MELVDPLRLLEVLSTERPLSRLVRTEPRTEESEASEVERVVRNAGAHPSAGRYALTAFSALAKYLAYYITYPAVHVYSEKPLEFVSKIPKGRGDVTLQVLSPDSELIFKNARRMGKNYLVEPIQVVIDLFCLGGPGRDGTMKLYEKAK